MSGIYQIYNPINNKRYIGSSINVERRLKEHLRNLEKNRHSNNHLGLPMFFGEEQENK